MDKLGRQRAQSHKVLQLVYQPAKTYFFPLSSIELVEEKLKKDVVHFNKFWLLNKSDTFFPLLVETQNSVINYNYGSKSVGFSILTFP